MTLRQSFILFAIAAPIAIILAGLKWPVALWLFVPVLPVVVLGVIDLLQTRHTVRRLYPFFGRFRYMLESVRPEIQQYFVESDTSGSPVPREFRSLVYQRAKGDRDTRPFGTIFDVNRAGYEWVNHSMNPGHRDAVKMIEIKLSQGAKPGHGGILPAAKLTEEIARIRNVPMGQDVISPPAHTAFSTPTGLLEFVRQLRALSGGKPVGFKLCIGQREQFLGICKAMVATGIKPDFITVDGGEGGTGAAPTEMTNSVGTPLRDALIFVDRALRGTNLRDDIRIIAWGKMFSAFHILRALALGADTVNSARGMMMALGCIQARSCNTDHCPTGIATQDPVRTKGLVVSDKATRVANFHNETVTNLTELLAAAGLSDLAELEPRHINRRVQGTDVKTYAELYPPIATGSLLVDEQRPEEWRSHWQLASADSW